jgi:hypothetical protein
LHQMQHVDAQVPALILRAGTTIAPVRRLRPLKDVMLEAVPAVVMEGCQSLVLAQAVAYEKLHAGMADRQMRAF